MFLECASVAAGGGAGKSGFLRNLPSLSQGHANPNSCQYKFKSPGHSNIPLRNWWYTCLILVDSFGDREVA